MLVWDLWGGFIFEELLLYIVVLVFWRCLCCLDKVCAGVVLPYMVVARPNCP